MGCETPYFSGLGNCQKLLSKVVGIGITLKGTTFTDATFISASGWKAAIASSTPATRTAIVLPLKVYEKTTDAPGIETSNLGIKDITSTPPPSMVGYIDASACDYATLHGLTGTKFDVVLFLADGTMVGTRTVAGAIKGFRAILGTRGDLPQADNAQQSYPVYVFFRTAQEFMNQVFSVPSLSLDDVLDYVPVGLTLVADSTFAASTGVVTLHVYKRGTTEGKTGLVLADITVLESNATAPTQTTIVTEVGQGVYTVTINESIGATPGPLEAGEWVKLQVALIASTFITYQSNVLKITAE
jgi:hypothetical protein